MTAHDILAQFIGTATNPFVPLAAIVFVVVTHDPWRVRLGTALVAIGFGLLEALGHGAFGWGVALLLASALAGLAVAEAVLHLLVPLAAAAFGVAHRLIAWIKGP